MFEVKVRDYLFIAHSLKDQYFGKAQNVHGVTYIIDLIISSDNINDKNVVIDIEKATNILKEVLSKYNYKNLDEIEEFKNILTTTEFMAKVIVDEFTNHLNKLENNIANIISIKAILNESHIASASYTKKF
ncbi:MAG: hypothetical protein CMD88_03820 [Gammaproteobacteria bacterium]|nr:hypothetical protein [Gammaproteobacteria bacterium]|tara:strand:+ start:184816 stop:185208 length:393 start_codon:yes stop_codon:yes gene_type:complete